jgi:hypothetical protein
MIFLLALECYELYFTQKTLVNRIFQMDFIFGSLLVKPDVATIAPLLEFSRISLNQFWDRCLEVLQEMLSVLAQHCTFHLPINRSGNIGLVHTFIICILEYFSWNQPPNLEMPHHQPFQNTDIVTLIMKLHSPSNSTHLLLHQ